MEHGSRRRPNLSWTRRHFDDDKMSPQEAPHSYEVSNGNPIYGDTSGIRIHIDADCDRRYVEDEGMASREAQRLYERGKRGSVHRDTSGDREPIDTSGERRHRVRSGDWRHNDTNEDKQHSDMSGHRGILDTSGDRRHRDTSRDRRHSDTGEVRRHRDTISDRSHRDTSWDRSHRDTSWERSHRDTSWDRSHRDMSGDRRYSDTSGDRRQRDTSSDRSHGDTTWDRGHRDMSGDRRQRDTSSDRSHGDTTWDRGHRDMSGDRRQRDTSSDRSHGDTTWDRGHRDMSGDRRHSDTSGDRRHRDTSSDRSHRDTTWDRGHRDMSGDRRHSDTSGDRRHRDTSWDRKQRDTSWDSKHGDMGGDRRFSETSWDRRHRNASGDRGHGDMSGDIRHIDTSGDREHGDMTGRRRHSDTTMGRNAMKGEMNMPGCSSAGSSGAGSLKISEGPPCKRYRKEDTRADAHRWPRENTDRGKNRLGRGRGLRRGYRNQLSNRGPHRPPRETISPMTVSQMENLLTKTDEDILLQLVDPSKGFKKSLDATQSNEDSSRFGLPLLLIGRACCTTTFPNTLMQLLISVRSSNWINRLPLFLQSITDFNKDNMKYIGNMISILNIFITKMPSTFDLANQVLLTVEYICKVKDLPPNIKDTLDSQIADLQTGMRGIEKLRKENKITENYSEEDFLKPPNDFLKTSILPSQDDLIREEKPFLRINKCRGRYQDLAHYLDVQFRLLRADFIIPLQNGIQAYLQRRDQLFHHRGRTEDIRLYVNTRVIGPVCRLHGVAYKIQFDTTRLRRVRWETSKRFLWGSLVCLSADNFETMIFGIVANRDVRDLSVGLLDIYVEGNWESLLHLDYSETFVMVESMALFEAYRPVLAGLKNVLESGLAMSSYIVECDMKHKPPSYLQANSTQFDMSFLTEPNACQWSHVPVLQKEMWPSADDIGLDSSQYTALQAALTREFVLIQGPPGTGKTFLGLKIAKVLLKNTENIFSTLQEKPMMVVCYTNHALDQFLEGIHAFEPDGIMRIGGRCQSKILENCMLHVYRKKFGYLARDIRSEMDETEEGIEKYTAIAEQLNKRILYTEQLSEVMSDDHMKQLKSKCVSNKYAVMQWLEHPFLMQYSPHTQPKTALEDGEMIDSGSDDEKNDITRQWDVDDADGYQRIVADNRTKIETMALRHLGVEPEDEDHVYYPAYGRQMSVAETNQRRNYLRRYLTNVNAMSEEEANAVTDVTQLQEDGRWRLYHFWLIKFRERLREQTQHLATQYHDASQRLKEINAHTDLEIMKRMKVIGLTTTGAARYQNVIQQLAPSILIIEEAAEVLEAHVVTALNPHCKHVILIGDHKQLRPSPAVNELARKYHLDISLFERMIHNGMDCVTLSTQHRMRPEISVLMKPIYPELKDHDSVLHYPAVRGIKHNLFLVDHQHSEDQNDDLLSKTNHHEANYIRRLCVYLLQQGYKPQQITVLTPYSAQMFLIRGKMPKHQFMGVRICILDNYQGEENDIVLLSLVRSNSKARLGFMGVENRICVALSRAKMGFYVIGDFKMFGENCTWAKVLKHVGNNRGHGLPLGCPNHQDNEGIIAATGEDFNQVPEGGCRLPCECRMPCGHTCPLVCHAYDQTHRNVLCMKPCCKILCSNEHRCQKLCHENCGLCYKKVAKVFPKCKNEPQHQIQALCWEDLSKKPCGGPCGHYLPCGHQCAEKCGSPNHTTYCRVKVLRILHCGHVSLMDCDADVTRGECRQACNHRMPCGHLCAGNCATCMQGRMHMGCQNVCRRPLVCNHLCVNHYCGDCPPCLRPCETRCVHNKCPKLCGEPCIPCGEPCSWTCKHYKCSRPCSEPCNRPPCDKRCDKKLDCGHQCVGVCGESCPPLCRICDQEELREIFFGTEDEDTALFVYLEDCGHVLEVKGLDQWINSCYHSKDSAIQPKVCPRCKTAIRKNLRYGNAVNASFNDIQVVKQKAFDEHTKLFRDPNEILSGLQEIDKSRLSPQWRDLIDRTLTDHNNENDRALSNKECADLLTLLNTSETIMKTKQKVAKKFCGGSRQHDILHQLRGLMDWLGNCPGWLHAGVADQLDTEWKRLNLFIKMCNLDRCRDICKSPKLLSNLDEYLQKMVAGRPLAHGDADEMEQFYKEMAKICEPDITEEVRLSVVQAMALSRGHWFKCPNGHVYVITECGGAMEESQCPECKERIGGTRHRLLESNRLAPEMDGARHAAWSDQANMGNYQLDDN